MHETGPRLAGVNGIKAGSFATKETGHLPATVAVAPPMTVAVINMYEGLGLLLPFGGCGSLDQDEGLNSGS
jgi:hypothetical protein